VENICQHGCCSGEDRLVVLLVCAFCDKTRGLAVAAKPLVLLSLSGELRPVAHKRPQEPVSHLFSMPNFQVWGPNFHQWGLNFHHKCHPTHRVSTYGVHSFTLQGTNFTLWGKPHYPVKVEISC
jgi:hypothetical protein